jgi:hypothetical protein
LVVDHYFDDKKKNIFHNIKQKVVFNFNPIVIIFNYVASFVILFT